jgi:hypothetical protein
VVLRRGVDRETLDRMLYFADWDIREVHPPAEDQPFEYILRPGNLDVWVHYLEDTVLELSYCVCRGKDAAAAARQLAEGLPVYADADIRREPASVDDWILRLSLVGALRPGPFDAESYQVVEDGLRNADSQVRRRAIVAIGYLGWRQFHPVLAQLAATDPDDEVRADAVLLLDLLRSASELSISEESSQ